MPSRKRHRRKAASTSALAVPLALWRVEEVEHVPALVEEIFSPTRYLPLLVVSTPGRANRPHVDIEALVQAVGDYANVAVLANRNIAWEFSRLSPDSVNVYGGATRLLWPNATNEDHSGIHPLFLTETPAHSPTTVQAVVAALTERGYRTQPEPDPPLIPWQHGSPEQSTTPSERDALSAAQSRIAELTGENATLRKQVRGLSDQVAALTEQVHSRSVHSDPAEQLRHEIRLAWLHTYAEADRETYPLVEYRFGPDFVCSVESIVGVDRAKIVAACVDVLTRRAWQINGRQARQMRASEDAGAKVRVRVHDGATAWRCNLQSATPSARRLMWWEVPDGSIELAVVALHDDTTFR